MKILYSRKVIVIVSALFVSLLLHAGFQNYGRDDWQKPDEVLKSMNLEPGDVIADIGAGDGYFTRRFALAVSPGGQALGLEVSSRNVESMKRDADKLGLDNYKAMLVEPDDPGFKPRSIDVVFLCNAYHHLSNRVDYFKKVAARIEEGWQGGHRGFL